MKHFKILMAVTILAVVTVVIYSCAKEEGKVEKNVANATEVNSSIRGGEVEEPCEEAMGLCNAPFGPDLTTSVTHPDYPTCTFEIKYRQRACPDGVDYQIIALSPFPFCQAFEDSLAYHFANFTDEDVALWFNGLEKELLSIFITINAYGDINNIPLCGSGIAAKKYGFTQGSCAKYCFYEVVDPENPVYSLVKATQIPCGSACCRTEYSICKNANGILNITPSRWSSEASPQNCSEIIAGIPCHRSTIWDSPCVPNCQAL